jgi:arylsulfatase A-like enzyme
VKYRKTLLLSVAVACIAIGAAAWRLWPSRRPNVILITIDTLRADRLSCYGYTKHRTPNFDRLAQEGVLFENAFCDVTWTIPSMASVMTGRYATVHGLRSSFQRLSPEATTLAELLSARGIHTAALIASFPLDSMFGLDQGFALYDDDVAHGAFSGEVLPVQKEPGNRKELRQFFMYRAVHAAYRPDNEQSDRAIRWLREERQEPFFLWLHYWGPHEKPQPTGDPAEQLGRQREQYDPDVVEADAQVGRVLATLDELGLRARTAVILHADHGQSLTEHDYFGHGRDVYDPCQHVPLLMRLPDRLPSGLRIRRLVRNIDLFPTMLDLMGVKLTVPVDGGSLLPLIAGKNNGEPEEVYVETYLSANSLFADLIGPNNDTPLGFRRLGVRTAKWKFIVNDPIPLLDEDDPAPVTPEMRAQYYSEELYDLRADPGETTNVIGTHADLAASFWKKMGDYQTRRGPGSENIKLDDASRERLRSLGYPVE